VRLSPPNLPPSRQPSITSNGSTGYRWLVINRDDLFAANSLSIGSKAGIIDAEGNVLKAPDLPRRKSWAEPPAWAKLTLISSAGSWLRLAASFPTGQDQSGQAQKDLIDKWNHIGHHQIYDEQATGDEEERRETAFASPTEDPANGRPLRHGHDVTVGNVRRLRTDG